MQKSLTGVPAGTSIYDAAKVTKALNTELGSFVMTGATTTNPVTGKVENISPALLSCMCAGMGFRYIFAYVAKQVA